VGGEKKRRKKSFCAFSPAGWEWVGKINGTQIDMLFQ